MSYSNKLPNDPKNPKKKRELAERAEREAKKKGDPISAKDKKDRDVELDPNKVEFFSAVCPECGVLGNYLRQEDAMNGESLHQQRRHGNNPGSERTPSVEAQSKRNRHGRR